MQISTKGRYSLEALLYMASLEQGKASVREISGAINVSEGYMEQIFISLRKARLVRGLRGPNGGYSLEKKAGDISVGEILNAAGIDTAPADCGANEACPKEETCSIRPVWKELNDFVRGFFDSLTLADLVEDLKKNSEPEYVI